MSYTIEDTLEILAGLQPRLVNIRINYNEKSIIKSIAKQVFNKIALTDRQLELAIKKIEKYKIGLTMNNINVDDLINNKPLRMPIREIDRTIRIGLFKEGGNANITIKFSYSKKFEECWNKIKSNLIGNVVEKTSIKEMLLTEQNIISIIENLAVMSPVIEDEIFELYKKIKEIQNNPINFIAHADYVEDKIAVKNTTKRCLDYINLLPTDTTENIIKFSDRLKSYGVYHKEQGLVTKLKEVVDDEITLSILLSSTTRFKFDSSKYTIDKAITSINIIDQWPLLIVVEETHQTFDQLKSIIAALENKIDKEKITVFFRLDKSVNQHVEFNQYVKDNHLNNFIDKSTKVVIVSKARIPKPLLRSEWKPYSALVMTNHYFGKISAFIDDFSIVYYYNNSILLNRNKIKGARTIVEL